MRITLIEAFFHEAYFASIQRRSIKHPLNQALLDAICYFAWRLPR